MVTPDAYAVDAHVLEKLINPIKNREAVCAYARQIPHVNADFWETFPRSFNYPSKSHIRSLADIQEYGVYTFFFSDSFGAYLNSALDEIGGFQPVLTGEDTVACAKLLHRGHKVAYVAEAEVHHSHRYTLMQEFKRHFDTGLARKSYQDLLALGGKDAKRGQKYLKELIDHLIREEKYTDVPYAFLHCGFKWLGYQLGRALVNAPQGVKKALSAQDFFWNSIYKS